MRLLLTFAVILALLATVFLVFRVTFFAPPGPPRLELKAHLYKDPGRSIETVGLKVFYAVPKNRTGDIFFGWKEAISQALEKAADFHRLQFRGLSELRFDLYPEPVVLRFEDSFYDRGETSGGNKHALIAAAEELEERAFSPGGDLYRADFAKMRDSEYPVLGLIYEGVGASGGMIFSSELESVEEIAKKLGLPESIIYRVEIEAVDGFFLLGRQFLTSPDIKTFGAAALYHELAHTFGLPDRYDELTNAPFLDDIMGGGRRQPIEITYLDSELLKEMGIVSQ